jgi:hypothetical protein
MKLTLPSRHEMLIPKKSPQVIDSAEGMGTPKSLERSNGDRWAPLHEEILLFEI